MSGIAFSEFLFLCMIGLVVLGPKRLPEVARMVGGWIGKARRMTRVLRRQLEEELDLDKDLNIKPRIGAPAYVPPHDEDSFSPLHGEAPQTVAGIDIDTGESATKEETEDDQPAAADDEETGDEERREA